jgi:hypothetical protein
MQVVAVVLVLIQLGQPLLELVAAVVAEMEHK